MKISPVLNLSPELLYVPNKLIVKLAPEKDLGFHSVLVKVMQSIGHPDTRPCRDVKVASAHGPVALGAYVPRVVLVVGDL